MFLLGQKLSKSFLALWVEGSIAVYSHGSVNSLRFSSLHCNCSLALVGQPFPIPPLTSMTMVLYGLIWDDKKYQTGKVMKWRMTETVVDQRTQQDNQQTFQGVGLLKLNQKKIQYSTLNWILNRKRTLIEVRGNMASTHALCLSNRNVSMGASQCWQIQHKPWYYVIVIMGANPRLSLMLSRKSRSILIFKHSFFWLYTSIYFSWALYHFI